MSGLALATAAQALVGTRFRLNGQDPATGLDCLGLVAASLAAIGRPVPLIAPRSLYHSGGPSVAVIARSLGLVTAIGSVVAGDVVLVRCSPVQLHVLVALGRGRFAHAHAGLRRVVIGAPDRDWRIVGHWRLPDPD